MMISFSNGILACVFVSMMLLTPVSAKRPAVCPTLDVVQSEKGKPRMSLISQLKSECLSSNVARLIKFKGGDDSTAVANSMDVENHYYGSLMTIIKFDIVELEPNSTVWVGLSNAYMYTFQNHTGLVYGGALLTFGRPLVHQYGPALRPGVQVTMKVTYGPEDVVSVYFAHNNQPLGLAVQTTQENLPVWCPLVSLRGSGTVRVSDVTHLDPFNNVPFDQRAIPTYLTRWKPQLIKEPLREEIKKRISLYLNLADTPGDVVVTVAIDGKKFQLYGTACAAVCADELTWAIGTTNLRPGEFRHVTRHDITVALQGLLNSIGGSTITYSHMTRIFSSGETEVSGLLTVYDGAVLHSRWNVFADSLKTSYIGNPFVEWENHNAEDVQEMRIMYPPTNTTYAPDHSAAPVAPE